MNSYDSVQILRRQALTRRPASIGKKITSTIALVAADWGVTVVPEYTQTLAKRGVTYWPLAEPDLSAARLVLNVRMSTAHWCWHWRCDPANDGGERKVAFICE